MKSKSNPFLRSVAYAGISLLLGTAAHADIFDNNGTTVGFDVTDGSTYYWWTPNSWSDTATLDDGTADVTTWQGIIGNNQQAYFVGSGTSGQNYTVRLGTADGSTDTYIQNMGVNVKADGTGALPGSAGNVTIGNSGDTGKLSLSANNSVGAQSGGTLTINNGIDLSTRTLNFRGGNVVINGVVSGTGTSKVAFGGGFGLTSGTLTLANTANTYAGRANTDYIASGYTLAVTKLANGASDSSIGTSSANIGINGGTLKYIGSMGAQSTSLGLHIASAGANVDASGVTSSDTISISGAPTYSALNSARTITLTGTNAGDNTMAFSFGDNGTGLNILTKTGVGRWVVNQANSYTGGTNARDGALVAANTAAFGAAGRIVNVGFNTSVGAVEFATDTTANAYVLNLSSGYTGSVIVNRATSGTTVTHTMGNSTLGNGTLNITRGSNVTGDATLEFGGITLSAGVAGLATGSMLNPTTANVLVSGNITRTGVTANLLTLDGTNSGNVISGIISGPQALTKSNTSMWALSGANTFNGKTLVTGGTLKLINNLAIQNSAFDVSGAGTLDVTTINTPTFGGLIGSSLYVLPANVTSLTLNPGAGTQTFTGDLSRTGGGTGLTLTKTGAGTQILGGVNSYTGLTTVNGGELRVTDVGAIGGTNVEVISGRLALDGDISVSGKSLTISGNGANFFGGLQSVAGTNEWAGSVLLGANDSRLGARKGATLVVSGVIDDGSNTYNFLVRNENQTNTSGAGNPSTITELSGANTYGGNTMVIAGVTRLAGGDNRLPTGTILQFGLAGANAKFDMNGRNQELAGLAVTSSTNDTQRDWNANELTNSSTTLSTLTVNTSADRTFGLATPSFSGSGNYTGIITGNIKLVKSGISTLTLSGANSYSGDTNINEGTLSLGTGTSNTGLADTADVAVAASAILDLNYTGTDTIDGLSINGVAKAPGVWGSVSSGAPNTDPQLTGSGTLTVTTGPSASAYDSWTSGFSLTGPNAAFDFDYDNDGIENGLEWILGGNPTTNSAGILPAAARNLSGDLLLTFTREEDAIAETTLKVEFGTDLASWPKQATIGATSSGPDANGVTISIDTSASPDAVTVTIPVSNAPSGQIFARILATEP